MDPFALDYLLSVDPGAHSAWVLWARESSTWTPLRVGREAAPSVRECRRLLGQLLPDWSRAAMVVEGQFFSGKHGQSTWHSVERLVESRCWWQAAAELAAALARADALVALAGVVKADRDAWKERAERARYRLKRSCLWPACHTVCSVLQRQRQCEILAALSDDPPEVAL